MNAYNTIILLRTSMSIVPVRINCQVHRVAGYPLIIYYLGVISRAVLT